MIKTKCRYCYLWWWKAEDATFLEKLANGLKMGAEVASKADIFVLMCGQGINCSKWTCRWK